MFELNEDQQSRVAMVRDFANEALAPNAAKYGYLSEHGLEKFARDLRVHRILEGSNEIMRLVVGRTVAGPSVRPSIPWSTSSRLKPSQSKGCGRHKSLDS